jgi:hypothetical protein
MHIAVFADSVWSVMRGNEGNSLDTVVSGFVISQKMEL